MLLICCHNQVRLGFVSKFKVVGELLPGAAPSTESPRGRSTSGDAKPQLRPHSSPINRDSSKQLHLAADNPLYHSVLEGPIRPNNRSRPVRPLSAYASALRPRSPAVTSHQPAHPPASDAAGVFVTPDDSDGATALMRAGTRPNPVNRRPLLTAFVLPFPRRWFPPAHVPPPAVGPPSAVKRPIAESREVSAPSRPSTAGSPRAAGGAGADVDSLADADLVVEDSSPGGDDGIFGDAASGRAGGQQSGQRSGHGQVRGRSAHAGATITAVRGASAAAAEASATSAATTAGASAGTGAGATESAGRSQSPLADGRRRPASPAKMFGCAGGRSYCGHICTQPGMGAQLDWQADLDAAAAVSVARYRALAVSRGGDVGAGAGAGAGLDFGVVDPLSGASRQRSAGRARPSSPYRRSRSPAVAEALAAVLPAARPLRPGSARARPSSGAGGRGGARGGGVSATRPRPRPASAVRQTHAISTFSQPAAVLGLALTAGRVAAVAGGAPRDAPLHARARVLMTGAAEAPAVASTAARGVRLGGGGGEGICTTSFSLVNTSRLKCACSASFA
jgi:hypothetical protein